jgi:hypothetical protein
MKRYLIIIDSRKKNSKFIKLFRKCKNSGYAYNLGREYLINSNLENRYAQVLTTTILKQSINRNKKVLQSEL